MNDISKLIKRAKIYGISEEVVRKIVKRDKDCIYCHKKMIFNLSSIGTPKNKATIEHFNEKYVYAAKDDGLEYVVVVVIQVEVIINYLIGLKLIIVRIIK